MVRAGDVGAAVELPGGGGEIEDRRGDGADVDDVDAGRARALDEARLERGGRLAVVLTYGDRAPASVVDERASRAYDEAYAVVIYFKVYAASLVIVAVLV